MRRSIPAWCLILAAAVFGTPSRASVGCPGDCDANGTVTVDELLVGVQIALGQLALVSCPTFDADAVLCIAGQNAATNILANQLTPTGRAYQQLIGQACP